MLSDMKTKLKQVETLEINGERWLIWKCDPQPTSIHEYSENEQVLSFARNKWGVNYSHQMLFASYLRLCPFKISTEYLDKRECEQSDCQGDGYWEVGNTYYECETCDSDGYTLHPIRTPKIEKFFIGTYKQFITGYSIEVGIFLEVRQSIGFLERYIIACKVIEL